MRAVVEPTGVFLSRTWHRPTVFAMAMLCSLSWLSPARVASANPGNEIILSNGGLAWAFVDSVGPGRQFLGPFEFEFLLRQSPPLQDLTVCHDDETSIQDCAPGAFEWLGSFEPETELVFALRDFGCADEHLSTDPQHAQVTQIADDLWEIGWDVRLDLCFHGTSGNYSDLVVLVGVSSLLALPEGQTFGVPGRGSLAESPTGVFGDPVNTATGSFFHTVTDLVLPAIGMPFEFSRSYNSLDDTAGPLGAGWTHSYNISLAIDQDGATLRGPDGQQLAFDAIPTVFVDPAGEAAMISYAGFAKRAVMGAAAGAGISGLLSLKGGVNKQELLASVVSGAVAGAFGGVAPANIHGLLVALIGGAAGGLTFGVLCHGRASGEETFQGAAGSGLALESERRAARAAQTEGVTPRRAAGRGTLAGLGVSVLIDMLGAPDKCS